MWGPLGSLIGNLFGALFKAIMSVVALIGWGQARERAKREQAAREAAEAEIRRRALVVQRIHQIQAKADARRQRAYRDPEALFERDPDEQEEKKP
jgi:hypothetical protein